jgi:Na+/pantothenate symporter
VAQRLLGSTGEYAMIILMLMAVMSTGSAEVIAVASIIIYDIYQMYIQPFRPDHKDDQCLLCGLNFGLKTEGSLTKCVCPNVNKCQACTVSINTVL